jgi:hypothetical protein
MDKHWDEVMELARKYGFIVQSYGGVATLATHASQKEHLGEGRYRQIQEMNGREVGDE